MRTPYIRRLRHRTYDRTRHSRITLLWLTTKAAFLELTPSALFARMVSEGLTANEVDALPAPTPPSDNGGTQ